MFNKKKEIIESLKNNVKVLNDERIRLSNENIVYQKELFHLRDLVKENNKMLKQLTEKKKPKKEPKELAKAYKKVVKKNEQ